MSEPRPVTPICPYCGLTLEPDLRCIGYYTCNQCDLTVLERIAESRPFRVEWGVIDPEGKLYPMADESCAVTGAIRPAEQMARWQVAVYPDGKLVRRLVSEWGEER